MDQDKLLAILKEFDASSAVSLKYKEGDTEFVLKKDAAYKVKPAAQIVTSTMAAPAAMPQMPAANAPVNTVATTTEVVVVAVAPAIADANLITIKSPIVGTFYRQPSPDAPAYVDEGTKIQKGMPLCILEAMKMMNTLESEYDGVIESVLVKTGDLVEFDQALFTVRVT